MGSPSTFAYIEIMDQLTTDPYNLPPAMINNLTSYTKGIFRSEEESKYSSPMLWIGLYIALASLICILAMVGDLLHGLRTRKLWFPCKYFTINAASLTVIAVAMKLPVDLTSSMPGNVDQVAKLGSMAFMCSMMANLFPSLETMDSKELFTNIVALVVLVITLVVNICIQIATGVVSEKEKARIFQFIKADLEPKSFSISKYFNSISAAIYVTLLLMLLIIHICSSLAILKSKKVIKSKYQDNHARALKTQQPGRLTAETLKQLVSEYWIIWAGSPQFITVCSATTSASGVICVLSTTLHIVTVLVATPALNSKYCESDYQWSMSVILVTQFIGVIVGTIAPLSRCFAASLIFKMSREQIWKHISKVFKTESYWIQKLSVWQKSRIPITFRRRKCKVIIENLKFTILNFLIDVQKAVVVTCKMISLIPFFFTMCVRCLKRINVICPASGDDSGKNTHQPKNNNGLPEYVLQLHKELKLHDKTLKSLWKSVNRLIQKAEKQQPNNLKKLLEESSGFEGVEKYANIPCSTISSKEYPDCWSLPVVTLTAIAVSLPNFQKDQKKADNFLESVSEAFMYVTLVEESLNATSNYVRVQKAAKRLWLEVEIFHKWLGHKLKDPASDVSVGAILRWFRDTAEDITKVGNADMDGPTCMPGVARATPDFRSRSAKRFQNCFFFVVCATPKILFATFFSYGVTLVSAKFLLCNNLLKILGPSLNAESGGSDDDSIDITKVGNAESGGSDDDSIDRFICATSMYRISKLLSNEASIDQVSQDDLLTQLSSMISGIVAACLTNLPQVIALKCHSSENVYAAVQLLGETTQIIKVLQDRVLPSLENPDDFHFIDKWCAHLRNP